MKILVCLGPLVAALACAQSATPKNVEGWGKITWQMTLAEVRDLYPDATPSADAYWSHLALPPITIDDIPMQVTVSAKKPSSQVSLIALWCYFGAPASTPGGAPDVGAESFETLKALMIQKYGHQKNEEYKIEFDDPVRLFLWTFPSTSIQLKLRQTRRQPTMGSLHIEFRALDPKALDVL